jgi:O-antigen/teichoic acid export membrane protein
MPADNKKIAKNTIFMYIRMIVNILIGFYTSRVILQVLGVSDFGIYNAVGGIVALFIFLNSAMTEATQRFLSFELGTGNQQKLAHTFSMCLNVHILISVIIVIIGEIIGLWLLYNKMVIPENRMHTAFWVFQFSIFASVFNVTQVPYTACLNAHEDFNIYALFQILKSVATLFFVILLKFMDGDKLWWYALFVLIVQLGFVVANRIYDVRSYKECRYRFVWDKSLFYRLFSYTSWSLAGQMSNTLADQGINLLMNMFFGPAVNAARGIAIQVQNSVSSLVWNFQGASIPQIVKLYAKGERESYIKLVNSSSKVSFFIFYLMVVPICFEMHMLLHIWLGQTTEYMILFSVLVLLNVLTAAFGGTLVFLIQATGKIRNFQLFSTISNLIVFPLTYLLYKIGYSAYISYILIFVSRILIDLYTFHLARKLADYPMQSYYTNVIMPEMVVSVAGIIVPFLLYISIDEGIIRLTLTFTISILLNTIFILYLGFNRNERKWIYGIVDNFIKKRLQ